ncbi:MAG: hypothetical protein ACK47N_08160 [Microcystis sp.]|uniref:hypothetical protein n=1 Tax=Microcystis sp. TaxID=1127 RepID=UPI00391CF81B
MVFTSILEILGRFLNYFGDLFLIHTIRGAAINDAGKTNSELYYKRVSKQAHDFSDSVIGKWGKIYLSGMLDHYLR